MKQEIAYGLFPDVPVLPSTANDFVYKTARTQNELEGFWRLRRETFCEEQRLFEGTDQDELDQDMIPIICTSLLIGMEDHVVGAVRIDEREPGLWWGSRLCVHKDYRHLSRLSASVMHRNNQPSFYARKSIGAGLIYKAVSTAHALGCHTFLATVQQQNARFFQRLHWDPIEELELYGVRHVKMLANLDYYPPATERV